jgi:phosphatidylglycerophosphate synthase
MSVRESIQELRAICQLSPQWQVPQPWAFLQIRKVSIYVTWILLHTPISANGVSLAGILLGVAGACFMGATHFVTGVILLALATIFDFSDGEVSRYRKQQSKQGSYLDKVYHFTVQPSAFAGITIGAFQSHPSTWILVAGFVSAISVAALVMVMAYANELAIWKHSRKLIASVSAFLATEGARFEHVPGLPRTSVPSDPTETAGPTYSSTARRVAELASLWDFPYIFFAIGAGALAQSIVPSMTIGAMTTAPLELVLAFYALTYPGWIAVFVFHVLSTQSTERGYHAFAEELSVLVARASLSRSQKPNP